MIVDGTVYEKGLADPESFTPELRLVFLVMDLEICADMEGWDHFFTTERGQRYFSDLIAGLGAAEDAASLEVLQDYRDHFLSRSVPFEAEAIAAFLLVADRDYFDACRDWRADFDRLKAARWECIGRLMSSRGYTLA